MSHVLEERHNLLAVPVDEYLAKNPAIAEALRTFQVAQEEYRRSLSALTAAVQIAVTTHSTNLRPAGPTIAKLAKAAYASPGVEDWPGKGLSRTTAEDTLLPPSQPQDKAIWFWVGLAFAGIGYLIGAAL